MPTRTEVVISIGEVLECLPPGKSYRRKRYNSFDANQALEAGNEENVAPLCDAAARCDPASIGMKSRENGVAESELEPKVLTVRRKTRGSEDESRKPSPGNGDEDDEVSFNPDTVSAIVENGSGLVNGDEGSTKPKSKRKSSAEKFLEDNVSYFQLEVLASKTRSSKNFESNGDGDEKKPEGFHNSFLDFLKSKGVEGKEENEAERSRSRHKSGPTVGTTRQPRQRTASCHQSPLRSDSEESFRPPSSRTLFSRARSRNRIRSRSRDFSASESETDNEKITPKPRRVKNTNKCIESSDDDSVIEESYVKSTRSRGKSETVCSPSPGKRSRRSELDKLLEAVDTSFHFETAAAAAKRMGETVELGPLEIDVSDSNVDSGDDEDATNAGKKRKHCETDASPEGKRKKKKKLPSSGDLLKTLSPRVGKKNVKLLDSDDESETAEHYWDGWEALQDTLAVTNSNPVELEKIHFSFESAPRRESWFQTYSRQDRGEDIVFYPESKSFPFRLPYELPYTTFMPHKPEVKTEEKLQKGSKLGKDIFKARKGKRKKVSECESTDSENNKKGKPRFGPKTDHLLDLHPRISPRCHASTKAVLQGGNLTDEELAEALLIEDERELHHPGLVPFYNQDETSNDSLSSNNTRHYKRENISDYLQIAASMDTFLRNTQSLGGKEESLAELEKEPDKVTVPTRSRISSEELLKNLKEKGKKKRDKMTSLELIMDKTVADNVDGILLDCLEDELPTIPFDSASSDTLSLLETYQSCKSMTVCNSRWLRPSRPSILGPQPETSQQCRKSVLTPQKPKRLVIYKEDLPGFKYDNDIETEKLPVSKRILAKSAKKEEPGKDSEEKIESSSKTEKPKPVKKLIKKEVFIARKVKPKIKVEPKFESDEDNLSEASSVSSRSRKKLKKRSNKTGFPLTKKKRKLIDVKEEPDTERKGERAVVGKKIKEESSSSSSARIKKKAKVDKFITKKKSPKSASPKSSSPRLTTFRAGTSDLGRRSTTLQSKNYSELESDTESLFEAKVPYRSPHMKMLKEKPPVKPKKRK